MAGRYDMVRLSVTLTALDEMHDRQIVTCALRLGGAAAPPPVLTRDNGIRSSGLVPVIW